MIITDEFYSFFPRIHVHLIACILLGIIITRMMNVVITCVYIKYKDFNISSGILCCFHDGNRTYNREASACG